MSSVDKLQQTVIIVPVHNALEATSRTLEDVELSCDGVPVVVVDDCSTPEVTDALHAWVSKQPTTRSLLRNNRQQLFTRSANRGMRWAWRTYRPQYLCILNSDCRVHDDWLKSIESCMRADPKLGMCGYRDSWDPESSDVLTYMVAPAYITGHCLLLRTRALHDTGVLCETDLGGPQCQFPELAHLKGMAHIGSDRLLSYKMQECGWKVAYCNAPGVAHKAGTSWNHDLGWLQSCELDLLWAPNDRLE